MREQQRVYIFLFSVSMMLLLPGCFLKREEGQTRTVLKKGWQVAEDMKGWVAVPNHEPVKLEHPEKEVKDGKEISAYRLATHDILPATMEGWVAINTVAFKRYSGTELGALNTKAGALWEMRVGRRIPADKDGWIGVPLSYPKIQRLKDFGLASLQADQLVPKEMDGWVAVDKETLAKLAQDLEMRKATIKKKKDAETVAVPERK